MVTHLSAEQQQLALRLRARGLSLRRIGPQAWPFPQVMPSGLPVR